MVYNMWFCPHVSFEQAPCFCKELIILLLSVGQGFLYSIENRGRP